MDEVVQDAPYVTDLGWMDKYNTKYCAHGDDIVIDANGHDTYGQVKAAGRFKSVLSEWCEITYDEQDCAPHRGRVHHGPRRTHVVDDQGALDAFHIP